MKPIFRCSVLLIALLITSFSYSQNTAPVNYLNTPAQLSFNNTSFTLAWSAHPSGQYYKQEYLPKGETVDDFKSMLLLEVVISSLTVKEAFDAKVAELKAMKQANPYVNFETFYHAASDEYVLDFVVTANSADGKQINIAERNIYRYKKYTGPGGRNGVILFGVSKRSYGSEALKFVTGLTSANRQDLVNKVKIFTVPDIRLK
ncbi:MAG: hypothetical protein DI535_09475 [Citrobacter freundii]|nr:MAG: hypothetical protein DI535_09475 [Citrobacter freundii]